MKIIFGRDHSFISVFIRLITWSRYSHVGIVYGDNVIEATFRKGVGLTPLQSFKDRYSQWEYASIPGNAEEALGLVGSKYDVKAVFGLFFRTGWDEPHKWFCSEKVGFVSKLFRSHRKGRITPEHIYMVSKPIDE